MKTRKKYDSCIFHPAIITHQQKPTFISSPEKSKLKMKEKNLPQKHLSETQVYKS